MSDIIVTLPNGGRATFPAGTPAEEITKALDDLHGGSTSDKVAQAFGGGALANMGDEATAAVRAAAPGFANWMMRGPDLQRAPEIGGPNPEAQTVSTAPTFGGRYDEELQREREKAKAFQESNPKTAMAANLAGSLATTALALPAGATAVGPSALMNVGKNAAVGAGIGGLTGFGEGEGLDDRLWKAGVGAVAGGAGGAAVRPLANIGRSVAEMTPVRQAIDPINQLAEALLGRASTAKAAVQGLSAPVAREAATPMAEQGAMQRLASTFQQDRLTPDIARQRLGALGPEAIPSDISEGLLQQGVNMKTLGGETRQRAKDLFDPFMGVGRDARTGQRMISAAEGNAPPPSHFQLTGEGQGFEQNARAVGQQAYQGDMVAAGFKNSPGISRLIAENPEVSGAIDRVISSEAASRAGTDRAPASVVEIMHMVKREIQGLGMQPNGAPSSTAAHWQKTANEFVQKLKSSNEALAKADVAYAQAKSLPEHYEAGSSIFSKGMGEKATSGSGPALEDLAQAANGQQNAATRAGVINAVRARAGTQGGALQMAQDIKTGVTPGGVQDALRSAMPDEAQALINRGSAERIFANTSKRYLGGPHTADDLAGSLGLGNNVSIRGSAKDVFPRFQEGLKSAVNWVAAPNEAVRNEIGRALLDANPKTQERTLMLIAKILQERSAGSPVAASLAGGAGAQVGRAY